MKAALSLGGVHSTVVPTSATVVFRSVPEQFAALIAMYEQGQIKPHIDRTFAFREAALAHHCLHDRSTKGKVLLIPE